MGRHSRSAPKDFAFNWHFVRSTIRLARLLYPHFEWASFFTVLTVAVGVIKEFVNYYSGLNLGRFLGSLIAKDQNQFWIIFARSCGMYAGLCLSLALISLFSYCLYLAYRKNVVERLHSLYFSNGVFYRLNCIDDQGCDNPDQRITQDVERACSLLATKIIPVAMLAPFTIGYYTYKTWALAGGFGVGIVYSYFIVGTVVNRLLLSPLTKWSARVERAEGDFRYKHVSIRDHAEEISFCNAASFEASESARLFWVLLVQQQWQVIWRFPAQWFQSFFNYFGAIMCYAIQIFPIFVFHSYDSIAPDQLGTVIANNSFICMTLVNCFTNLTDLAQSVAEFAGYVQRITELEQLAASSPAEEGAANQIYEGPSEEDDIIVQVTGLTIAPPATDDNQQPSALVNGLSFTVSPSSTLLVMGPSGAGKSSLLRCIARLWPLKAGSVRLSSTPRGVLFLPQRPYLPVGRLSLKQQIVFPLRAEDVSGKNLERVASCISLVGLDHLVDAAGGIDNDVSFEWQEQLSPGEQQRLSIARVLFHEPSLVILDEATSSLSESVEMDIYQQLRDRRICYISTGHRSTLLRYHDNVLQSQAKLLYNMDARLAVIEARLVRYDRLLLWIMISLIYTLFMVCFRALDDYSNYCNQHSEEMMYNGSSASGEPMTT